MSMSDGSENSAKAVVRVVDLLEKAQNLLFITGAGVSADSGLPTYRGVGGLYNDRVTDDGVPIETALAGDTLVSNPALTWKYLSYIEERCRQASFNRAHQVIAEMEKHFKRVWVLTQNIDGLHTKAGSRKVIEIHGNMYQLSCLSCDFRQEVRDYRDIKVPPHCPRCRNLLRPDVVFFGERLPYEAVDILERELQTGFDVYFSVGTTSIFPYIRSPMEKAAWRGRATVEINPGLTDISRLCDVKLTLPAVEAMERIWQEYQKRHGGKIT